MAKSKASKSKPKSKAKSNVKSVTKSKPALKAASKPASKPTKKPHLEVAPAKSKTAPQVQFNATKSAAGLGMKRFSPLDDRILVERVAGEERTAGGLYIPDTAQEKPTTGRVVAVGRGHRDAKGRTRPCDVKVGDTVLFTAWSGAEIEVDGAKYVIMRETDLLGVTNTR